MAQGAAARNGPAGDLSLPLRLLMFIGTVLTAAVAGRGVIYYLVMGSVITVVCLSANTSYADFPRFCRLLALVAASGSP